MSESFAPREERIPVFCNDALIGDLFQIHRAGGMEYGFQYHESAQEDQVASLTMPVTVDGSPAEYRGFPQVPHPFQVSLPEGWVVQHLAERFGKGIRLADPFSLLKLVGRGLIGRITVGGMRQEAPLETQMLALTQEGPSATWIEQVLVRSRATQFGLSGVMPKMQITLPDDRRPGTFCLPHQIVKLESPGYFGVCLAEDLALLAARHYRLETVQARLNAAGDALFVDRFDRKADGRFLGFEDACALTGFPTGLKYDGCLEKVFIMVEQFVSEEHVVEDKHRLLKLCILNEVLRNGDAHLKNFGLLYNSLEEVRLAPVYDVLDTTLFIPDDIPALTLTQYFPDEAPRHKRWLIPHDVDALVDVADLPGVNGRHMVQEAIDAVADASRAYGARLQEAGMRNEPRASWAQGMTRKIDERLRTLALSTTTKSRLTKTAVKLSSGPAP